MEEDSSGGQTRISYEEFVSMIDQEDLMKSDEDINSDGHVTISEVDDYDKYKKDLNERKKTTSEIQGSSEMMMISSGEERFSNLLESQPTYIMVETIAMAIKVGIGLVKDERFMFTKGNLKELLTNSDLMKAINEWKETFKDEDIKLEKRHSFSYYGHLLLLCCSREQLTRKTINLKFRTIVSNLKKLAESHVFTVYGDSHNIQGIISPIKALYNSADMMSGKFLGKIL